MGREARAAALRQEELTRQGNELRHQLIRQGKQLKTDKQVHFVLSQGKFHCKLTSMLKLLHFFIFQTRLEVLQKNREEALKIRTEKEYLKNTAEGFEKTALDKYREVAMFPQYCIFKKVLGICFSD